MLENENIDISLEIEDVDNTNNYKYYIMESTTYGLLFDKNAGNAEIAVPLRNARLLSSNVLNYVPDTNYFGDDEFTVMVEDLGFDGTQRLTTQTNVSIQVVFVNQPPELVEEQATINVKSSPADVSLLYVDMDEVDEVTVIFVQPPTRGRWRLKSSTTFITDFTKPLKVPIAQETQDQAEAVDLQVEYDDKGGGNPFTNFSYYILDSYVPPAQSVTGNVSIELNCEPKYNNIWSNTGPACADCPKGGLCSTRGEFLPYNDKGYYPTKQIGVFLPCDPVDACPAGLPGQMLDGGYSCMEGYSGDRCGQCASGWFRKTGRCEQCPKSNMDVPLFVFLVVLILMVLLYLVSLLRKIDSGFLGITLTYLQSVAMFATFKLNWSPQVRSVFHGLSFLNLNVEVLSPECYVQDSSTTYELKWNLVMLSPVILLSIIIVLIVLEYVIRPMLIFLGIRETGDKASKLEQPMNRPVILQSHSFDQAPVLNPDQTHPYQNVSHRPSASTARMSRENSMDRHPEANVFARSPSMPRAPNSFDQGDFTGHARYGNGDARNNGIPHDMSFNHMSSHQNTQFLPGPPPNQDMVHLAMQTEEKPKIPFYATMINLFIMFLCLAYLALSRTSLEIFDCSKQGDEWWFDVEPSRKCYEKWWYKMLPFAFAGILFYVIGIPLLIIWLFMMRRRALTKEDEERTGFERVVLYVTYREKKEYRDGKEFWDAVLLGRKLLIVISQLFFTSFVVLQAIFLVVVFQIVGIAHTHHKPYVSHTLNNLEMATLVASSLVLISGIMFYVGELKTLDQVLALSVSVIFVILMSTLVVVMVLVTHLRISYQRYKQKTVADEEKDEKFDNQATAM